MSKARSASLYRPVANDRLNLLTRYTYLKDMGPVGQVTQGGQIGSPKQKSQIFAIDANYDLTRTLTLGGKYAFRKGSVSLTRDSDTYVTSNTWLGVARIDWRLVRQWDVLVEGHYLSTDRAGDHRWGRSGGGLSPSGQQRESRRGLQLFRLFQRPFEPELHKQGRVREPAGQVLMRGERG